MRKNVVSMISTSIQTKTNAMDFVFGIQINAFASDFLQTKLLTNFVVDPFA